MKKTDRIREFIREHQPVAKKEIVKFLIVELCPEKGVTYETYDHKRWQNHWATNFTTWKYNGHLVSHNGMYSLTPEGAKTKVGMFAKIPELELKELREANKNLRYNQKENWRNERLLKRKLSIIEKVTEVETDQELDRLLERIAMYKYNI